MFEKMFGKLRKKNVESDIYINADEKYSEVENKPPTHVEEFYLEKVEHYKGNRDIFGVLSIVLLSLLLIVLPILRKMGINIPIGDLDLEKSAEVITAGLGFTSLITLIFTTIEQYGLYKYRDKLKLYQANLKDEEEKIQRQEEQEDSRKKGL